MIFCKYIFVSVNKWILIWINSDIYNIIGINSRIDNMLCCGRGERWKVWLRKDSVKVLAWFFVKIPALFLIAFSKYLVGILTHTTAVSSWNKIEH